MAYLDPAVPSGDIDLPSFKLNGKALDARVAAAVTDASIEMTIEAAPSLELVLADPDREILRSRLFGDRAQMWAVGQRWEWVQTRKSGDQLTITFEQFEVAALKRRRGARKTRRGKSTRAEFVKSLVDEIRKPKLKFICPELHTPQPIERARERESRQSKDDRRARGIAKGAKLTFRGGPASPAQLALAERCLDVADAANAEERVMLALAMAGINETGFTNPPGSSDGLSKGVLQLQTQYARGTDLMDPEAQVRHFLFRGAAIDMGAIEYARKNPTATPAEICRAVWGGTGFDVSTWTRWAPEARALIDAYGGNGGLSGGGTRYRKKPYYFTRRRKESTWKATGRLAEEVGWRRFVVRDKFYFVAEADLMRSRPRMRLSEDTPGVDTIDFDIDVGRDADEATVQCRARVWQAPPGSVVVLDDCGPEANGRWLVSTIRRGLFSLDMEITLRRKRALLKDKPEPAPETVAINRDSGGGGVGSDGDGMLRPVDGTISSGFGPRNGRMHQGVDIAVTVGTPIRAALSGKVEFAGEVSGYGYYMKVRHSGGLVTAYAHLSAYGARVGQRVERGEVIAKSGGAPGAPGAGNSSGPHLHFEVIRKGVHVDPDEYI